MLISINLAQVSNELIMSHMQEEYQVPGHQMGTHCDLSPYPYTV